MKIQQALEILGLSGTLSERDITKAYRSLAKKYHPDINPIGADMMIVINNAYEALRGWSGTATAPEGRNGTIRNSNYLASVFAALEIIRRLDGLKIEIIGCWAWVTGETRQHREALKSAGLRWHAKKTAWYIAPEAERGKFKGSKDTDLNGIRAKYGSYKPDYSRQPELSL